MRFTIVGAGAIGGITGAYLARAGHDVRLVDKAAEHVEAINRDGLRISGHESVTARVPACLPEQVDRPLGVAILAVKAHDTESAVQIVTPHLADDEYVVSMQNGLEEPKIARAVGTQRTVGAFLTFGGFYAGPGQIVYGGPGSLRVGELDGAITPRVRALRDALSALQPVEVTDNIMGYLWGKLALGSIYFATAVVDADVPDIFDHPDYQPILVDLCGEVVAVAEARGVRPMAFDGFDPTAMRFGARDPAAIAACWDGQRAYWNRHEQRRTGVWRDLAIRKRKTEADALLGALLREADTANVSVPRNRTLYRLIKEIEEGRRPMAWSNLDEIRQAAG